ncbi:MAG: hypothetical protein GEU93_13800, partial [Propionibacteriales bacterium]|nr:hypothetical protein [Propionibacteriales bacterium]
ANARGPVAPQFEVDPFWPKPLPNDWVLGQVAGIEVDDQDRIWIVQRPGSLTAADLNGASPAPPVMAFDVDGNLLEAWGPEAAEEGQEGPREWAGCDWPINEHGLWIDGDGNIWIAGNGGDDHIVLKFTSDGSSCLLQIGEWGVAGNNDSEDLLNRPADGDTDDAAREVYVADGYGNNRVAVFDMDTGEFKRRHLAPDPENDPWSTPVHCAVLSDDGLLYVCDRVNNRIHVLEKDGTFVEELPIVPGTPGNGSAWDVSFSADSAQEFLYNADGYNQRVQIARRNNLEAGLIAEFGRNGRYAGMFHWIHNIDTDSRGNLYVAEVDEGKRTQKFDFRGLRPVG